MIEVVVKGFNEEDGIYLVVFLGVMVVVDDWFDIEVGLVFEV